MHFLCLHLYQRYCQKMPLPSLLLSDQSPNQIELTASPEQKEEEKTDRKVLQPPFPKWRKLESNRT